MIKIDKNRMGGMQTWKLKHFFICMRDYDRYMYKLVYSRPQLSPTFSALVSPDAALSLTTHSPDQGAQKHLLFTYV